MDRKTGIHHQSIRVCIMCSAVDGGINNQAPSNWMAGRSSRRNPSISTYLRGAMTKRQMAPWCGQGSDVDGTVALGESRANDAPRREDEVDRLIIG